MNFYCISIRIITFYHILAINDSSLASCIMAPKIWTAVVNKKLLPLQNEINPFVVVWIVPMQPQLSKTAMKGKMSKKLEVA